eukprot:TRINITY_DN64038_c0_g1_i1.p1 TRINITY_DN64038_c0_g1~~TRINITY_DN64038_c0_g1_i1.p1  ORF type:complete len:252 (-),score=48.44 TRINITY_DN64038_c0_g1_i1:135-890(-)
MNMAFRNRAALSSLNATPPAFACQSSDYPDKTFNVEEALRLRRDELRAELQESQHRLGRAHGSGRAAAATAASEARRLRSELLRCGEEREAVAEEQFELQQRATALEGRIEELISQESFAADAAVRCANSMELETWAERLQAKQDRFETEEECLRSAEYLSEEREAACERKAVESDLDVARQNGSDALQSLQLARVAVKRQALNVRHAQDILKRQEFEDEGHWRFVWRWCLWACVAMVLVDAIFRLGSGRD